MPEDTRSTMVGALSIQEFCRWSGIGRTNVYEQIARGELRARKLGRRTLIPLDEAERWLAHLPCTTARAQIATQALQSVRGIKQEGAILNA